MLYIFKLNLNKLLKVLLRVELTYSYVFSEPGIMIEGPNYEVQLTTRTVAK